MPRIAADKDPFEDLPEEWKDAVDGSDAAGIKARIVAVFQAEAENLRNRREDLHVQESKLAVDRIGGPYKALKNKHRLESRVAARQNDMSGATDAAIALAEVEDEEANDGELETAKEVYKDSTAGYTDATKENDLKVAYCLRALSSKGKNVTGHNAGNP